MKRIFLAVALSGSLLAADHIRVILDNSRSMRGNDMPRLAPLATVLLFDLANPNLSLDDSFEVLMFDPTIPLNAWKKGAPPPGGVPRIKPVHLKRAEFVKTVLDVHYDSWNTYYLTPLQQAIDDLKRTPGGTSDRRVVVLITDGMPEDPDEGAAIRDTLIPELTKHNIPFGPEAFVKRDLIQKILGGSSVGELFGDKTGAEMLNHMIEIYSRSFGYTAEAPVTAPSALPLDLEAAQSPERVAVVQYWKSGAAPAFHISSPAGGSVNNPDGYQSAVSKGASYTLSWILRPAAGRHQLKTASTGGSVAVLRPRRVEIEIMPQTPGGQVLSTMSRTPMPVRVLVRPPGGAKGLVGQFDFTHQTHGPLVGSSYEWDDKKQGPPSAGTPVGAGLQFDIFPEFPRDPAENQGFYEGWLSIELSQREAVIARKQQRVFVYPYVRLTPVPETGDASVRGIVRAVERNENGCASFELRKDGSLPHANNPNYSVQAFLDGSLYNNPALSGARFTLDGKQIDYEGHLPPMHGPWTSGVPFSNAQALIGKHELCVSIGKPKAADPSKPLEAGIRFKLLEHPYNTFPTIQPFTLKALISPPSFLQRWAAWIGIGLTLLSMVLLWMYSRYRPALPPALRFAFARQGVDLKPKPLGEGSPVARALARVIEKPVMDGPHLLGYVRPVDPDLYVFRPSTQVRVASESGEDARHDSDGALLAVRRTYRLKTERGEFDFRMEYE
jgi:hypothetical protein